MQSPSSVKPSLLLVRQRSSEVESALLEANRGDEARYNKSVREIAANLSRNSMLTKRLLEGRLSASTLVTMDVREMAPEHVQRARKERQEEAFRRRTHLGEKGEMRLKSLEASPHRSRQSDSGPSGHTPVSERKRRRVIEDDDEDDEDEEEAALPTSAQTTQDTVAAADDDEEEASTDSEDDRPIKQVYKEKNPGKGSPRTPNRERGSTPKKSPRKEKAVSPASEEETTTKRFRLASTWSSARDQDEAHEPRHV